MNRDFYHLGIFFLSLHVVAGLFHSIIFFQIDYHIYSLHSFSNWLLVLTSLLLVSSVYMLKYYHHKRYRLVFITALIASVASLLQYVSLYFIMRMIIGEIEQYYTLVVILALGLGVVYATTLVFSKSGENPWLKGMGIYMLLVGGFSVYVLVLSLQAPMVPPSDTITQLSQWLSLAGSLIPVPLIVLFNAEMNSLKAEEVGLTERKSPDFMYAVGGITFLITLVLGVQISHQSYSKTHISPRIRAMAEPFEARSYVNNDGDTLLYRLLKPLNYNPDQSYPMVVCLHGGAGWGTDNYRQFEGSLFARMLTRPENRENYPAFLFVPQCPPGSAWGNLPNHTDIDSLVFATIDALKNEFAIDENRVYVAGHSLGGYGTWHFIGTRPGEFAAAIPVAGEGDPALASNMRNVDIWAFHGANDRNVPVSGSRDVIAAIRAVGGDPRYTESPYGGHSWEIVEDTPGVLDWLFAQERNDEPR